MPPGLTPLGNHANLNSTEYYKVCDLKEITGLITDLPTNDPQLNAFRNLGLRLLQHRITGEPQCHNPVSPQGLHRRPIGPRISQMHGAKIVSVFDILGGCEITRPHKQLEVFTALATFALILL